MSDHVPTHQARTVMATESPHIVAVLGSTGFVGRAVAAELRRSGLEVRPVTAPRVRWPGPWPCTPEALSDCIYPETVEDLARQLAGVQVVVNAAGLPDGTAPASPDLYGANALLPSLILRAGTLSGVDRYVHLSSAAAQGHLTLDETDQTAPFSPYSHSKALGERLLLAEPGIERVVFRCTWVHDAGRPNTQALIRLARSPLSCVAGDGSAPTPHVLVADIADSVAYLALARGPVPRIVLQPPNGMTTGELLRLLGGREPRHVPWPLAQAAVRGLRRYGRLGRRANAHARRIELVLFGKPQVRGWLAERGVLPALRAEQWRRLASIEPLSVAAERV